MVFQDYNQPIIAPQGEHLPTMETKIAITTLGCKVNQYDSATMEEALREKGYQIVDFPDSADIYIINTCTVTKKTDYQSRQLIRRAQKKNPEARIIVTGCYAQVSPQTIAQIPGVSLIIGNVQKLEIVDFITDNQKGDIPKQIISDINQETFFKDPPLHSFPRRTRAFLKIQDGCEAYCSYCIVPYARGKYRSLAPEEVLKRLFTLSESGFKEVVITGIHLSAYGVDHNPSSHLLSLLRQIEQKNPVPRIRLSSVEPMDITDELIEFLRTSRVICPHLHLPLQSGDDEILTRMNRPYGVDDFRKLAGKLFATIPDLCLGVDVIVGFPGENDNHFHNTCKLLEELPLSYFHVFPYSQREGTKAAEFPGQVESKIISARSERIRDLGKSKREQFYSHYLKKKVKVLLEGKRDRHTSLLKGRSRNYIPVLLEGPDTLKNQEIEVEITRVEGERVWGGYEDKF
jgi:threonylcarbamoyladenosine tRNA methylthiotransferase MtaB